MVWERINGSRTRIEKRPAMGRNNKWIESQPDDSVPRIGRRALSARLQRVCHYLNLAVREPATETENVHQLRVFSRRAAAALEIFEDWLPPRRGQWVAKQVKKIRKAAGEARDLDVLMMRWAPSTSQLPAAQAELLLEHARYLRHEAQRPIYKIRKKLVRKRFARRAVKFLKRLHHRAGDEPCGERFACMARMALNERVVPFLAAADGELNDFAALHAFRIQGKQVRYAMEIFAGAFDANFRDEVYPLVAALQEMLGAINDHVTADAYLAEWQTENESAPLQDAIETGRRFEQDALALARKEFLAWWTPERRSELRLHFAPYMQSESSPARPQSLEEAGD
jgi:CHAD domain-containing protein